MGMVHLIFGILLVLVGVMLMQGSTFARVIAIILVSINMIAQFGWTTLYPFWSLIAIAPRRHHPRSSFTAGKRSRPQPEVSQ